MTRRDWCAGQRLPRDSFRPTAVWSNACRLACSAATGRTIC